MILTKPLQARLEENIINLCNLELISKQLALRSYLEKYWKIILYHYIHVTSEIKDGKEIIISLSRWNPITKEIVRKLAKKSNKRMFAIMNEVEKRTCQQNLKENNKSDVFKLCISGHGGSGVHSFINRYMNDRYCEEYDYPIDDVFNQIIYFNQHRIRLEIWDSAFRNEYYTYDEAKLRRARGYIVLISVRANLDDFLTFDKVIRSIVYIHDDDSIPITVCINQIDRLKSDSTLNLAKVKEKIIETMKGYDCSDYEILETSSKDNTNIQTAVDRAIEKGYFFNTTFSNRRQLLEKVLKKDSKVFNESACLIA